MYDEFTCEAIPLLIGGYGFSEHNRSELAKARDYWKLHGNEEKAKEYEEAMKRY